MYDIWAALREFFTGKLEFASKETVQKRHDLCYSCEVRDERKNVCTACGCYIPIKIRLKKSECPMEKW